MSGDISFSATLVIRDGGTGRAISCRACGGALCPPERPWKEHAHLDERALRELGGPYAGASAALRMRRFHCPSCAALLDSEVALEGEPFLTDRVEIQTPALAERTGGPLPAMRARRKEDE